MCSPRHHEATTWLHPWCLSTITSSSVRSPDSSTTTAPPSLIGARIVQQRYWGLPDRPPPFPFMPLLLIKPRQRRCPRLTIFLVSSDFPSLETPPSIVSWPLPHFHPTASPRNHSLHSGGPAPPSKTLPLPRLLTTRFILSCCQH